eukprot:g1472.t1
MRDYRRLPIVKNTSMFIVDQLKTDSGRNKFGLVTFSSHSYVLADLQPVTNETAKEFDEKINGTRPHGRTDLYSGVIKGIEQQAQNSDEKFVHTVFLLTDGKPKGHGFIVKTEEILRGIREALKDSERDIALYTFGVGTDLTLDLLREIADLGRGISYVIPRSADIAAAFGNAFGGLETTIAIDVQLKISGNYGAKILDVEAGGVVERQDDGSFVVHVGDLFKQEYRDILIKVQLPQSTQNGSYISVTGTYTETVDFDTVSIPITDASISRTEEPGQGDKESELVGLTLLRFQIAKDLDDAAAELDEDEHGDCDDILSQIKKMIDDSKFKNATFLQHIKDDLDTFLLDLTSQKNKTDVELQAELYGIRDAIKKQRTGLTDKRFHTVNDTKTEAESAVEEEAVKVITVPPEPPTPPPEIEPAPAPAPEVESQESELEGGVGESSTSSTSEEPRELPVKPPMEPPEIEPAPAPEKKSPESSEGGLEEAGKEPSTSISSSTSEEPQELPVKPPIEPPEIEPASTPAPEKKSLESSEGELEAGKEPSTSISSSTSEEPQELPVKPPIEPPEIEPASTPAPEKKSLESSEGELEAGKEPSTSISSSTSEEPRELPVKPPMETPEIEPASAPATEKKSPESLEHELEEAVKEPSTSISSSTSEEPRELPFKPPMEPPEIEPASAPAPEKKSPESLEHELEEAVKEPSTSISSSTSEEPHAAPSEPLEGPYAEPSISLEGPYAEPSISLEGPYAEPSISLEGPYAEPSISLEGPYVEPSISLEGPYAEPYVEPFVEEMSEISVPLSYEEPAESPMESPEPLLPFDMKVEYSIVDETIIGDYKEVEVVITLYAPDMVDTQAPLSLTTVLDRSSSMYGVPFNLLKKTQKFVLDTLLEQKSGSHSIGMIFFSDKAETFLKLQPIVDIDVTEVKRALDAEEANGTTAMEQGLLLGVDQQASHLTCAGLQVVFLFTDGKPTTPSDIPSILKEHLQKLTGDILVYTFGLGSNVTDQVLIDISKVGGGRFYILQNARAIPRSFGDALGGLLSLAAKNITVSFSPYDQVEIIKTFPKTDPENDEQVLFHDLYIEEKREILVTMKIPKDANITRLLDFVVSYNDAATCDAAQSGTFCVEIDDLSPEGKTRVIEAEVVQYLKDAETRCESGDLEKAIEILTEAVVFVSESAESMDQPFIADLLADLVQLKTKCEQAKAGAESPEKVMDDIQSLKAILETQRSTSAGHSGFHVEPYYDTSSRKQLRKNFTEDVIGDHPRPRLDAVEFVHSTPIEVVSVETRVTVPLEISVIDEPDPKPALVVYISFIIDARINSTVEEISKASEFVLESLQSYMNGSVTVESSAAIIVLTADAELLLPMTPFSEIDMQEVQTELSKVMPAGNGSFFEAVEEALADFDGASEDTSLFLCPIAGSTVLGYDSKTEVESIEDTTRVFGSVITYIPAAGSQEIIEQYFGAFPDWLKTQPVVIDPTQAAVDKLDKIVASIGAKRLTLKFIFTKGATPLTIDGSPFPSDNLTIIADVQYSQKLSIPIGLKLDSADEGTEVLFYTNASYFDTRSMHIWEKSSDPFIVTRVDVEKLKQRVDIRNETQETMEKLGGDIEQGDYEKCLEEVVKQLARMKGLNETNDTTIEDIKASLEDILRDIQDVQDETKQPKELQFAVELLKAKLDVESFFGNQTSKPEEPQTETEKPEAVVYTPPETRFSLGFKVPKDDETTSVPQNITANLTLEVPPSDGKVIDARIAIILDTSETANMDTNLQMTEALLNQVARRKGRRAVQILSWNEGIVPFWETEDITLEQVETVMEMLRKIQLTGFSFYYPAITRGFHLVHSSKDSNLELIWWIVSSDSEDDEDYDDLIAIAESDLKSVLASVTVFSFFSGLNDMDGNVVKEISRISGGDSFDLDMDNDYTHTARKAAYWIDTTLFKNVEITVKPSHAAELLSTGVNAESSEQDPQTLTISSMQCKQTHPDDTQVGVHLALGWMTGVQELFRASGLYFNLRSKQVDVIEEQPYLIKRINNGDLEKLKQLEERIDKILAPVPEELSKGNIPYALDAIRQCQILTEFAGIGSTYLLDHIKSILDEIETLLEELKDKEASSSDLALAVKLMDDLRVDSKDQEKLLSLPPASKETFSDKSGQFKIPVWLSDSTGIQLSPELLSFTVVFDAGFYRTIIDPDGSVLDAQKQLVITLVTSLVQDYGHQIDFTFIVGKSEDVQVSSPLLMTNLTSVEKLNKDFEKIEASGKGIGFIKSLELGLSHQAQIQNSTRRTVLVFSEASSICSLAKDQVYEDLIAKYSYQPFNPIRVLTFIVGKRAPLQTNDPVSALTGGARYYFSSRAEIATIVSPVASLISQSLYCSIQLTLTPVDWLAEEELVFPSWSYIKNTTTTPITYIASVPDIPSGEMTEFNVSLKLGEWSGSAPMFICSVQYYRTDLKRWMKESGMIVRITRVSEQYITKWSDQDQEMDQTFNTVDNLISQKKFKEAKDLILKKLAELDKGTYLDSERNLRWTGKLMKKLESITSDTLMPILDYFQDFAEEVYEGNKEGIVF